MNNMEKKKKVTEWLEQAKEQGYEWAQSAIEQTLERKKHHITLSLSGALFNAFDWAELKEGLEYWANIYKELAQKGL